MFGRKKSFDARVEVRPAPEVGEDPRVVANNRQLSGIYSEAFPDTTVDAVGRLVEFQIEAKSERKARETVEGLMNDLLVNEVSEHGTYTLEKSKPPDQQT